MTKKFFTRISSQDNVLHEMISNSLSCGENCRRLCFKSTCWLLLCSIRSEITWNLTDTLLFQIYYLQGAYVQQNAFYTQVYMSVYVKVCTPYLIFLKKLTYKNSFAYIRKKHHLSRTVDWCLHHAASCCDHRISLLQTTIFIKLYCRSERKQRVFIFILNKAWCSKGAVISSSRHQCGCLSRLVLSKMTGY